MDVIADLKMRQLYYSLLGLSGERNKPKHLRLFRISIISICICDLRHCFLYSFAVYKREPTDTQMVMPIFNYQSRKKKKLCVD